MASLYFRCSVELSLRLSNKHPEHPMSTKSLLLLLSFAALFLGAAAQAHGEMKICHRERGRGPNSALRCLRSKSLDGKMKRRMKKKKRMSQIKIRVGLDSTNPRLIWLIYFSREAINF